LSQEQWSAGFEPFVPFEQFLGTVMIHASSTILLIRAACNTGVEPRSGVVLEHVAQKCAAVLRQRHA
jgi:hypothetical protein